MYNHMLTLVILIVTGLFVAYFATQNTQLVTLTLANSQLPGIPIYQIVIAALLLGIVMSWIMSLSGTISSSLAIFNKNRTITSNKKEAVDLHSRINQLERENEKLKDRLNSSHSN